MSEAEDLWNALELREGDTVVEALLIAKVVNFEKGGPPNISTSSTDGLDWIQRAGLVETARDLFKSTGFEKAEED